MSQAGKQTIKVILVDDHPMLRAGFISSLADYADIEVVGETGDIDEVLDLVRRAKPDVTVLDVMFGGEKTGLGAIRLLREANPSAKVVALSQFDQDAIVREAYKFGAMAFITKDSDVEQLVKAVRKAYSGERYYLPKIAERLADMAIRPESTSAFDKLSERECAVLGLIGEGKTTLDIATALDISSRTVVDIIQQLRKKFGVERRRDLIPIGNRYNAQKT